MHSISHVMWKGCVNELVSHPSPSLRTAQTFSALQLINWSLNKEINASVQTGKISPLCVCVCVYVCMCVCVCVCVILVLTLSSLFNKLLLLFCNLFFPFFLLLLCCGYIVAFTKALRIYQMYHIWIHPLHHSPLSLLPPFLDSFNKTHFSIYIHVYTIFVLYLPSYRLSPHSPHPTGTNPLRQYLF
jgi:hypothetical protein